MPQTCCFVMVARSSLVPAICPNLIQDLSPSANLELEGFAEMPVSNKALKHRRPDHRKTKDLVERFARSGKAFRQWAFGQWLCVRASDSGERDPEFDSRQ